MPFKASGDPLKHFIVIGRALPTAKEPNPTLHRMEVFASNHVVAKSRFWYTLDTVKKTKGEIVSCEQVFERYPGRVKNYGVWIRFGNRRKTHNQYREYRDISVASAVTQAYRDVSARHHARSGEIQIVKVKCVKASQCRRPSVKQFHNSRIKFPLVGKMTIKKRRGMTPFTTARPATHFC